MKKTTVRDTNKFRTARYHLPKWKFRGFEATEEIQADLARALKRGKLPRGEAHATRPNWFLDLYRFVGRHKESAIRDLLEAHEDSGRGPMLTRVSIGTGYTRHAEWVGSKWDTARNSVRYLATWRIRPSSQGPLRTESDDQDLVWEVEVLRPRNPGQSYEERYHAARKTSKAASKSKAPKRDVSNRGSERTGKPNRRKSRSKR